MIWVGHFLLTREAKRMRYAVVVLCVLLATFPNDARADLFDFGGGVGDLKDFGDLGDLKDLANDFIDGISKTALDNVKGLSDKTKKALGNSDMLYSLSDSDFKSIPLDVLANLKDSLLLKFDAKHLKLVASNFSKSSSAVLHQLMRRIPDDAFKGSLGDLSKLKLSAGQYYAFGKKAVKAFGSDVSKWTKDQIKSLGNMNFGLSMKDLSNLPKTNFGDIIKDLNDLEDGDSGRFSASQVFGMVKSAKNAWGSVSTWTSDKLKSMKSLSNRFPAHDIAKLNPSYLADAVEEWGKQWKYGTKPSQKLRKSAVLDKLKDAWGPVKEWTKNNVEKLKGLLEGMTVKDLRSLNSTQFNKSMSEFLKDDLQWSWKHLHAMAAKGKKLVSDFSQLDSKTIKATRRFFPGLLLSDLRNLSESAVQDALSEVSECFEGVQDSFSQVEVLLMKVSSNSSKIPEDYAQWDDDVLDSLKCLLRGLLCGQLDNVADLKKSEIYDWDAIWSAPQLLQIMRELLPVTNLANLKKLVYGVSADNLLKLSVSQLDLKDVDEGGYNKMTRAQLLALLNRLKDGNTDLSNEAKWGWETIKHFGRVLQVLSPSEVQSLPVESYEDIVQAASEIEGLTEGQAKAIWMTVRKRMNPTSSAIFANVTSKDIAVLGSFVIHMGIKDLMQLDSTACMQAIEQMGETAELSSRTSPERRAALAKFAMNCLQKQDPDLASLNADHVFLLGRLVASLDSSALEKIGKSVVSESLGFLGSLAVNANSDELQTLAGLIKKHWDVKDLTADQLIKLGQALKGFSSEDIKNMDNQAIADAMEDIGIGSDVKLSSTQSAEMLAKIKAAWGQDVSKWGADQILRLGRLVSSLSKDDLASIPVDQFGDLVDYLGQEGDLSEEQIAAVISVAKKAWGNFLTYSQSQFRRLGYLAVGLGLTPGNIANLTRHNLGCSGTGYVMGRSDKWTKTQLAEFIKFVKRTVFSSDVSSWREFELTILGNITSGLTVSELQSLPSATLRQGLNVLGNVVADGFTNDQLSAIVTKLKTSSVLGSPNQWTRSQIYEAGNLLKGLSSDDIKSLSQDQLSAIDFSKLTQLGSTFFSSMASDQLSNLEPQQARAISAAYSSQLSAEQTIALAQATEDDLSDDVSSTQRPTPKSGARLDGIISMLTMMQVLFLWVL